MECDRKAIEEAVSSVVDGLVDFTIKMTENSPVHVTLPNGEEYYAAPWIENAFFVEINHGDAKIKFQLCLKSVS